MTENQTDGFTPLGPCFLSRKKAMAYFKIFFILRRFSTSAYFLFSIWFNTSMQAAASCFKLFTLFRLMEITEKLPHTPFESQRHETRR